MNTKKKVWVALGSNLGDSNRILQEAWHQLGRGEPVELVSLSHPYITEPVGMDSDNIFLNAVGILETSLTPDSLLAMLQQVERGFGRNKKSTADGYQDRLLDLDILYFDDCVSTSSDLVLPHPHISERLFVLEPLIEIDPDRCDPGSGLTAVAMHQNLLQRMEVGSIAVQEIKRAIWA